MTTIMRTYVVTYLDEVNERCTMEVQATSKAEARAIACKVAAVHTIRRVDPVQPSANLS